MNKEMSKMFKLKCKTCVYCKMDEWDTPHCEVWNTVDCRIDSKTGELIVEKCDLDPEIDFCGDDEHQPAPCYAAWLHTKYGQEYMAAKRHADNNWRTGCGYAYEDLEKEYLIDKIIMLEKQIAEMETLYIRGDKEMMDAINDYDNGNAELIKETDLDW